MLELTRVLRRSVCLLPGILLLAFGPSGCTCGSPYEGEYFDGDRPAPLQGVKFVESEKGDPKIIGCSDGQREAFAELDKFPRIAGCVGVWKGGKSLRDKPTGKPCGDDGEECAVPADLCAEGWHVCGIDGQASDLRDRVSADDCSNAGPGRFNAAMSHSPTDEVNPCPTIRKNTVLPCQTAGLGSEPVCCGNDCLSGKCKDGVWKGKTQISRGTTEGCGSVTSDRNGGVLCCYSGTGNPADAGNAPDAAGADAADAAEAGAAEAKAAEAGDQPSPDEAGKADAEKDAAGGDSAAKADPDTSKTSKQKKAADETKSG